MNLRKEIHRWNRWFRARKDVYILDAEFKMYRAFKKGNSVYLRCIDLEAFPDLDEFTTKQLIENGFILIAPEDF
jgi:hypothetical protein